MKTWDDLHTDGKSFLTTYRAERVHFTRWHSFWEAADNSMRRFKIYRWYWQFILCSISSFLFRVIEQPITNLKERLERFRKGWSRSDAWNAGESVLDHAYHVINQFMLDEWGEGPITEFNCETHDKKMYLKIRDFIDNYEIYHQILISDSYPKKEDGSLDLEAYKVLSEHEREVEERTLKAFNYIMSHYYHNLWT